MKVIQDFPEVSAESPYDIAQHAVRFVLLGMAIDLKLHDFFEIPQRPPRFPRAPVRLPS